MLGLARRSSWLPRSAGCALPRRLAVHQGPPNAVPRRQPVPVRKTSLRFRLAGYRHEFRVGTHPTDSLAIVVELSGPHEWSVDQPAPARYEFLLIPGAGLDDGMRGCDYRHEGVVRSIQPVRQCRRRRDSGRL